MQAMVEELQAGYERLDHAAKNASEVHEVCAACFFFPLYSVIDRRGVTFTPY